MSYLGLETVKPIKPMKRGDLYSFPVTTVDQIITDEDTNERLPEYLDKNFGMDLLWQNANQGSSFEAQTISLNTSPYSYLLIWVRISTAYDSTVSFLLKKDRKNLMYICIHPELVTRNVEINSLQAIFEPAYINGVVGNNALIPQKIYGIK